MAPWSHSQNIPHHWSKAFPTKAKCSIMVFHNFLLLLHFATKFINDSTMISVTLLELRPLLSFLLLNVLFYANFRDSTFPPPWHLWYHRQWEKSFMKGLPPLVCHSFIFSRFCSSFCSISSSFHRSFLLQTLLIWDLGKSFKLFSSYFLSQPHPSSALAVTAE